MAEEKTPLPREPAPGFVGRLIPDPASPPELTLLVGYPGDSPEKGSIRLYATPDLSRWWEIPEDDVLYRLAVPNDPLGAEIVWVRRDQQPVLNPRRSESEMYTYTQFPPPTQPTADYGFTNLTPTNLTFIPASAAPHCLPFSLGCTFTPAGTQATPAGAAAAAPPNQPAVPTLQAHCSLVCPTTPLTCSPSIGCPPQAGGQFFTTAPPTHFCTPVTTTIPAGGGPVNTQQIPSVQLCTYGTAQGHPHTFVTVVQTPHCPAGTVAWPPPTQDIIHCGTTPAPTTPVGAAAAFPPTRQNFFTETVTCTCPPSAGLLCSVGCSLLCGAPAAANPQPSQLCTVPPPHTAVCTYNAFQAQGQAQVFTTVPTALTLCTTLPPSFGCPPQTQAGAQAQANVNTVKETPFCTPVTTTPVGAGPVNTVQTPPGGTYAGAAAHTVFCWTTPVAQGAPALPSVTWPTIPPFTICCPR